MDTLSFSDHLVRSVKLIPIYAISLALLFMPYVQNIAAEIEVTAKVASIESNATYGDSKKEGKPVRLLAPGIGLDLNVVNGGTLDNGEWILSENNVHHSMQSAYPNNKSGNTVMYGHDRENVLKKTSKLVPGDKLKIITSNKLMFTYKLKNERLVNPENLSVLKDSNKPELTLITCYGYLSQERRIMQFELDKVTKVK